MITSIIILTYNKLEYTQKCIESIRKNTKKDSYELIVVDNCSKDGTREWLKNQSDIITIFNNENLGFPKGCNQGIELSKGENVLLLNNDTIVTENWLNNLIACLYSSEVIGAVGPVTNSCAYYQAIETDYNSLEEMQSFGKQYNVSDKNKWEERLKLIAFCMIIKREIIEKIGLLDEIFSPGNYEDDDYSIRIKGAGYKLILCKDTFIHHYGGTSFKENKEFSELLRRNETKFNKKWGFTSSKNMEINRNLIGLIEKSPEENFNALQIGCGCGATLLYLKNQFVNAKLYGIDINNKALDEADFLIRTLNEDIYKIDTVCTYFADIKFEYIFINSILFENNNNVEVLGKIKNLLKDQGKIYIELKVDVSKEKILTKEKLIEILIESGYKNIDGIIVKDEFGIKEYIFYGEGITKQSKEDIRLTNNLKEENGAMERKLKFLLRRIENNIETEESRGEVSNLIKSVEINLEDILFCAAKDIIKKDEVLNSIAVKFYEEGLYDNVIPLFQAAYEHNPKNADVIYNLAYFLYGVGERKLALTYLEKVEGTNKEVDEFIVKLRGEV